MTVPPPRPAPPAGSSGTGIAGMHSLRDVPSPYSARLAIAVLAVFAAPNVVFLLLDRVLAGSAPEPSGGGGGTLLFGLIVALVLQLIIFVVALLPLVLRRRLDRRLFGPSQPTGSWLGLGLGMAAGIAALFAAYGVNIILTLSMGAEEPVEQQLLQDALRGGASLLLAAIIAVIVAPIVEEVVLRGVVFRALGERLGPWLGAVLSSALFAFIHVEVLASQPIALGGLFAVGVVLAIAYHVTGNLLVPIVGHAVFNASSLAIALAVDRLGLDELVAVLVAVGPVYGLG